MPRSFLVKKKAERFKRSFGDTLVLSTSENGFKTQSNNQVSSQQPVNRTPDTRINQPKLYESRLQTAVYEPKSIQVTKIIDQVSREEFAGTTTKPLISSATSHTPQENSRVKQLSSKNQCQYCRKAYTSVTNLLRHQQFHCSPQMKRPFQCKHCEKLYFSLGALKMHIRTHTLPCLCKICGKSFSRPWLLQGHIRTHTGEKPYKCQQCERAFADRSNLRAHMQTHSDVKKYCCSRCSKSFSRMSLLHKHSESCQEQSSGFETSKSQV